LIRGALWTFSGYGVVQGIRLVANLLLARWLAPEAFGVLAIANSVQIGLLMVSDVGIGPSIIRDERGGEPRFLDTLWTLQILRGVILAMVAVTASLPLSRVYDVADLQVLLALIAAGGLAGAFSSTSLHTLPRDQRLARLNLLEIGIQVVAYGTMLGVAWQTRSVWSLALGGLVHGLLRAVLSHVVLPGHRHRLAWDPDTLRDTVRFGRWIVLSTLITFLAAQSDRLTLGLLVPVSTLGVYAIASGLALLPREIAGRLADSVILPYLAPVGRSRPRALPEALARVRALFLPIGLSTSAAVAIGAPLFFRTLYDERYGEAARLAPWIVLLGWIVALVVPLQRALLALGSSRPLASASFVRWAVGLAASLAGHRFFGLPGFVLGLCLGAVAGAAILHVAAWRRGIDLWMEDLGYLFAFGAVVFTGPAIGFPRATGSIPIGAESVALIVPLGFLTLTALWTARRVARVAR